MDFGIASINCLSMMVACEGWSDASRKNFFGTPFTDATAGCQSNIDRSNVITVGPGLTNAVDPRIKVSTKFTAKEIMSIWSKVISNASKDVLRLCPNLKTLPQCCKDMAIDCYHSGPRYFINAGWPKVKTQQDCANACLKMPKTSKGIVRKGLVDRRNAEAMICLGKRCTDTAKRYTDAYYTPNPKLISLM